MTCANVLVYYAGNTMVVRLTNTRDDAGTVQTGGAGTATVYDASGALIGSGSFVDLGGGTYRAVLAHTLAVAEGMRVDVDAILDVAGVRGRWRVRVPVVARSFA